MSIKPVDYVNIVSKSQEIAKLKQIEHDRIRVQAEQGVVQQEKLRETKSKKVLDTNKSENLTTEVDKRGESGNYIGKRKNKKKDKDKKKDEKKDSNHQLGSNVDIKI